MRKKEYDNEHLSRQLTTAKAIIVSLENKVLDIKKENDNLKTHLLASNSTSQTNIGHIQPNVGSPQMEMNLAVRLQTIENELLRLRLNMQDTAGNAGMKCNPCDSKNISENRISSLESRILMLESENRLLGNRLFDTEFKLKMSENELRLRQAMATPSYFQAGYNLQYMPAPVNKQTVITKKSETLKTNTRLQKGSATNQRVPGQRRMGSEYKSVSDCYRDIAPSENDCNESVICMEDNGENHIGKDQKSNPKQIEKYNEENMVSDKEKKGNQTETVPNVDRNESESDVSLKNTEHKQPFLSLTQPQLQPPWYQKKNLQN